MRLTTLHKVVAHDEGAWSCAWVPGSNRLLTASVDESVKVWEDTPEGLKFQHTYQGHSLGVVSVATSSNGQYAASSALDSYVRVWSLADHSTAAMIEVGGMTHACAFCSPVEGDQLRIAHEQAATTETWALAFSPVQTEGELLLAVAGGTRGAVVLWSIRGEEETATFKAEMAMPAVGGKVWGSSLVHGCGQPAARLPTCSMTMSVAS